MKQRGFAPIILFLVLGIGLLFWFKSDYGGQLQPKPTPMSTPFTPNYSQESPSPRPTVTLNWDDMSYIKRHGLDNPLQMPLIKKVETKIQSFNISDSDLIALSCTPWLSHNDEQWSNYEDGKVTVFKDELFDTFATKVKKLTSVTGSLMSCRTKDGKIFSIQQKESDKTITEPSSIVQMDPGNDPKILTKIPGGIYGGCSHPLFLSNQNLLYISCGGGEGGYGYIQLFEVNTSSGGYNKLLDCVSEGDNPIKCTKQ